METSGPTSGIPRVTAGNTATATGQWQVGQLLQATVTESSIGKVLLAIGNRQVSAETSLPLQKGQQLSLEVRSLGQLPVLRLSTAISESPTAMAARLLLPRHGPVTPLLANLNLLAQTPNPPVPPLVNQLVRTMVKQMPDISAVSSAPQLKNTIENSGIFLEPRLLQRSTQGGGNLAINTDFKANLLRLVQLVRNWPGSSGQPAVANPAGPASSPPPAGVAVTATPTPPPIPAGTPDTTPDQAARVVLTAATRPAPAAAPPAATSLTAPTGTVPGVPGQPQPVLPGMAPPPPLAGTVPVPQAAVASSLDLLNRLGNLRADLLQQVEAALARTQLQQLAVLPREDGERALLEWLLEVPVRRGDDIDLWSLRIFREAQESQRQRARQAQRWTVQLAFDLPGLGPMQVQVSLAGEQVSTRFWAAQEDTLPLVREHLHELRQALLDAGLDVGDLDCQTGNAPAGKPRAGEPLISEKA